jgi:hypothetical protein
VDKLVPIELLNHSLWKRELYTQDIDYIIGANIFEYDMRDAGFNIIKYYELLDDSTIKYLASLSKDERKIRIGLLQREDRNLAKEMLKGFAKMRKKFFIDNKIEEHQILSIRKDAIFLINKRCDKTSFSNVEFALKNRYTSFHKFGNYEYYFRNKGREIAVKGINDDKLQYHEAMLSFLKDIFSLLETADNKRVVTKIKKFASQYKAQELDYHYYRELNANSMYNLGIPGRDNSIYALHYLDGFDVDHSFNYMTYIITLIQRFFFISK